MWSSTAVGAGATAGFCPERDPAAHGGARAAGILGRNRVRC
jgi:hypothetical protein